MYMLKGRSVETCTRNIHTCYNSELVIIRKVQDNSLTTDNFRSTVLYIWPL